MGKNTSIEWTEHTFNPWWGCAKVSPACTHCYAEAWAARFGGDLWGAKATRKTFGDKHWQEPLRWNTEAAATRSRMRVFCASMADVFEARTDLDAERGKLWQRISQTPWLDWLLLTKRPENIGRLVPWTSKWPSNVWLGTTVENQEWAERRLPHLLSHPSARRFLSCEPLLGALDLSEWTMRRTASLYPIDWVIAGGESGPSARPMLPGWVRRLRDQCRDTKILFHFKQWGHWAPAARSRTTRGTEVFWDEGSRQDVFMEAKGKKNAGRRLDGRTWDERPKGIAMTGRRGEMLAAN
ncbi:MAG: phage Gp37/Gp68 family protein [Chthoniobacteraceae bacterium]